MAVSLEIPDRLAEELLQWVIDQQDWWPDDTVYQEQLTGLRKQLDDAALVKLARLGQEFDAT